jgi:hypothetical protein
MKYKKAVWVGLLLIAGMCGLCAAAEVKHTTYGEGNMTSGQIFNGVARNDPVSTFTHRWLQTGEIIFGDRVTKGDRLTIDLSLRGILQYSFFIDPTEDVSAWTTRFPNWAFQINRASATYVFGNPEVKPFSLTFGFFPYKYNPDVKNLGEYLFRSMAYPNFLNTTFDEPYQRILGIKLSSLLFDGRLRQDLIISNEWDLNPTQDFSIAYVAGCAVGKYLDVGLGGQASRLISVDNRYTDPSGRISKNAYSASWYYASAQDSINDKRTYYAFPGIKLMGRFNVKPLANAPEITLPIVGTLFGKQDLNFYAEANVLGLKNYKTHSPDNEYYNKLSERIPITFGINAPTNPVFAYGIMPIAVFLFGKESSMFKKPEQRYTFDTVNYPSHWDTTTVRVQDFSKRLIWSAGSAVTTGVMLFLQDKMGLNVRPDVLNFEFEYWSSRYPNSFENVFSNYSPIPEATFSSIVSQHNRWHWSVYASKQMAKFFVNVQIAHDHLVPFSSELHKPETSDALGAAGLWWWTIKTGFRF